jgi:trans-aconitate methyltransferase
MNVADAIKESASRRLRTFAPGRQFRVELARRVVESLVDETSIRVLDAGCEDGLLALTFARRHPSWHVVGTDVNDAALDRARRAASAERLENADFAHVDITKPFGYDEYDVVVAIECLAEIPDDAGALTALCAALKPGGLFAVHVPEKSWRPVLRSSPDAWRREVRHGYTQDELREKLASAGLDDIDIIPTMSAVVHVAEEIRTRMKSKRFRTRMLVYPFLSAAARAELAGLAAGGRRALFATARRRKTPPGGAGSRQ